MTNIRQAMNCKQKTTDISHGKLKPVQAQPASYLNNDVEKNGVEQIVNEKRKLYWQNDGDKKCGFCYARI